MISAFKLSMRLEDQPMEENQIYEIPIAIEKSWWESGTYLIYPESKFSLAWGVSKTVIIFISLFTLSYSAAF
jgi:hypothetical protein